MEAGHSRHQSGARRTLRLARGSRLSAARGPFELARTAALSQLGHLRAGDFDAYEADLPMYAEQVAAAVGARLTTNELSELAGIDSEARAELARLKDEVVARLAGMARRSHASSAYLTRPPAARTDARSA